MLPEYYEEGDGGRGRRNERGARRSRSLERRNTVADVETVFTDGADGQGAQGASEPSASIIHEVQFVPGMASSSKRDSSMIVDEVINAVAAKTPEGSAVSHAAPG